MKIKYVLIVKETEQVYKYLRNDLSIGKIKRPEASVIEIYDLKYGNCQNSLEDYFKELTGGVGIA